MAHVGVLVDNEVPSMNLESCLVPVRKLENRDRLFSIADLVSSSVSSGEQYFPMQEI